MITWARELYRRHGRWTPIVFFIAGFAFDAIMLRRIDELAVILQQAAYLVISAGLVAFELVEKTREIPPPRWLAKAWRYRESVLHFLLGTLLNSYAIFYFKSASQLTSLAFVGFLAVVLTLNEFKRFGDAQTRVHAILLSLCLVSYTVSLAPILLGFIGTLPFLCSMAASMIAFLAYYHWLQPKLATAPNLARSHILAPFIGVLAAFTALYFAGAIPPVPLSVTYMGIFHEVQKSEGEYRLSYSRSSIKFWQHGDQTFLARPGDTVHCFVQVFSPSRFKDELQVRWLFRDERLGWQPQDAIPMPIVGGREEGFRGVTKKINYQPGDWRVQIETLDGREIGWIGFRIEQDSSTDERLLTTITR